MSLHLRCEHFLHQQRPAATAGWIQLPATIGPDGIRNATKRNQSFIVTLLIAVVDAVAGKDAVAIVLVGAGRAYSYVRRVPTHAAVCRSRQVVIRLITRSGRVVT